MRSPSAWWSVLLGSAELYWALPLLPPAVRQKPMPNEVLRCTCNMLHSSCYCFCEQLPKDQRQFFACVAALSVLCPPPWRAQNDTRCSKIRMKADFGILNSIQTWSAIQIQEAVAWLLTQVCNVRDPKVGNWAVVVSCHNYSRSPDQGCANGACSCQGKRRTACPTKSKTNRPSTGSLQSKLAKLGMSILWQISVCQNCQTESNFINCAASQEDFLGRLCQGHPRTRNISKYQQVFVCLRSS